MYDKITPEITRAYCKLPDKLPTMNKLPTTKSVDITQSSRSAAQSQPRLVKTRCKMQSKSSVNRSRIRELWMCD